MAKRRRRKRIKKADIVTPAEAKAKEEESKKKKKVVIPAPKQDKKPEKKPETNLQDLGRHNLNLVPLLGSDFDGDKDSLVEVGLYPPDPREIFTKEEMGDGELVKVSDWIQILSRLERRFPLMKLKLGDEESSQPDTMAFMDEEYQCKHWYVNAPPTWMDPHVFAGMLLKDKQFVTLLKESVETNSRKNTKAIIEVMQKCFDEKYLPYLFEQFNKVKPLMANWFLARQTWVQGDEYKPGPERKKKKPKTA